MDEKKNICLVSSFYPPHIGGVERYVRNLATELSAMGHNISVLSFNTESLDSYSNINNFEIFRLPCYDIVKNRFPFPKKNNEYKELIKKLINKRYDAIILNQRFYRITKTAVHLAKRTKSPLYLIEHVTGHFTVHNNTLDFFGHIYEHRITDFLKKHLKASFGVSKACTKWLEHFGIKTNKVLYNGISQDLRIDEDMNINELYNIPEKAHIFFHAGRLVEEKGILYMTEAFRRLFKTYKNIYLIISGEGPLYNKLKQEKHPNIILTGNIEHSRVLSIIKQSDCVVIPSFYPEGLPTLILEAGLCKTPVISTPMGGTTEILHDKKNGLIVETRSAEYLTNAMKTMICSDKIKNDLSNELHKKVTSGFTWDKICDKLIEYIS